MISTLDGKISALNPEDNGSLLWTVHPGHEPMLSSSIHRLEVSWKDMTQYRLWWAKLVSLEFNHDCSIFCQYPN